MLTDDVTRLIRAHGLRPEALDANRAGNLTPEQARTVQRKGNLAILVAMGLGGLCLVLGILGIVSPHSVAGIGAAGVGALIAIALGVFLLFLAFRGLRRFPDDLAAGRVSNVEGIISKFKRSSSVVQGATSYTYHYRIKSLTFTASRAAWEMLDERQRYRVYYLPRSKLLVNLEPIGNPLYEATTSGMAGTPASVAVPTPTAPAGSHVLPGAEEVSAILGEPYHLATPSSDRRDDLSGRSASATYEDAARTRSLAIKVLMDANDVRVLEMYLQRLSSMGQPIANLGDEAFFLEGALIVRRGIFQIFITLVDRRRTGPVDPTILDAERHLAEMILARLSG